MITPFSILLIVGYFVVFFKYGLSKKTLFIYFVTYISLELLVGAGFFIKISSFELLYSEFSLGMLFVFSIPFFVRTKIKSNTFILGTLFSLSIFISYILAKCLKYNIDVVSFSSSWEDYIYYGESLTKASVNSHSLLLIVRILMFCFIMVVLKNSGFIEKQSAIKIIQKEYVVVKIFIAILFFEFLLKYLINPYFYSSFINFVFGIGSATYYLPIYRSGLCCMQGIGKEPSALSFSLFFSSIVIICHSYISKKNKYNFILFFFCQVFSLLSLSLSSIIFIAAAFALFILFGKKNLKMKTILLLFFICIAVVFIVIKIDYFSSRINMIFVLFDAAFNDKLSSLSYSTTSGEVPRIISIISNLKYFSKYPIFGIGIGSTYAHSCLASILSNVGVLGFALWLTFVKKVFGLNKANFVSVMIIVFIFLFQGYFGMFYSIAFVTIICFYFYFHKLSLEGKNDRRSYC